MLSWPQRFCIDTMRFSIIIPARNESARIGACLVAIAAAAAAYPGQVEVIVVLNRCTDATEAIAAQQGATIVHDDRRNLAMIRNSGARHARGDILVTIDADSSMSSNMLMEIDRTLASGRYIGGGVPIVPERFSVGIVLTGLLILSLLPWGMSAGLFWCYRRDFEAIGGFNEQWRIAEDVDFARRLKAHGRALHKRFGTLWRTRLTTSCRKFDRFGDWFLIVRPRILWRALHGIDDGLGDTMFYDFTR